MDKGRHPESPDIEGRFGPRRLLRTGLGMVGAAVVLWLLIVGATKIWVSETSNPLVSVVVLTSTVVLWPAATLGLLVLLCWVVLRMLGKQL